MPGRRVRPSCQEVVMGIAAETKWQTRIEFNTAHIKLKEINDGMYVV